MENKKRLIVFKSGDDTEVYVNPDNICAIHEDTYCGDHRTVIVFGSEAINVKDSVPEVLNKINGM